MDILAIAGGDRAAGSEPGVDGNADDADGVDDGAGNKTLFVIAAKMIER